MQAALVQNLDSLVGVNAYAERVLKRQAGRVISNCKVMARRLTGFDYARVVSQLRPRIASMYDFLQNAYKGFYCTLADPA